MDFVDLILSLFSLFLIPHSPTLQSLNKVAKEGDFFFFLKKEKPESTTKVPLGNTDNHWRKHSFLHPTPSSTCGREEIPKNPQQSPNTVSALAIWWASKLLDLEHLEMEKDSPKQKSAKEGDYIYIYYFVISSPHLNRIQ